MRNTSVIYRLYTVLITIITAAAVVLRTVACFKHLDASTGYFTDKPIIDVAGWLAFAAALIAASYIFVERGGRKLIFDYASPLNYVFAGTLGAALAFISYRCFTIFKTSKDFINDHKNIYYYSGAVASERIVMIIALAAAILAAAAVMHFVLAALVQRRRDTRRADFGLVTVIFLALYAAYLYFSRSLPINSPCKITDEMAYLAAAIFFLYETRISIGREKWRRYCAFGMIAMTMTAYSAIPALLVYIFKGKQTISDSIYETMLTLALFLFIAARLALTARLTEEREHRTVAIIREAAQRRADELAPAAEEPNGEETNEAAHEAQEAEYYGLEFEEASDENVSDE